MKTKPCRHETRQDNCRICHLYETDSRYRNLWGGDTIQVCCSADGIGDALLGLTTTAGLKRDGFHVTYSLLGTAQTGAPWQEQWVRLFHGYDRVTTALVPDIKTVWPHETYGVQNSTRLVIPRWEHYARVSGTQARLPHPKPLDKGAIQWGENYRGFVALSPFSCTPSRAWLLSHWLHLERLINESGRRCLILDGRTSDPTRTNAFRSVVLRDEPASRIAAALAVCDAYVGNDSGLTHLAGLLSVPTLALCAQIKGEQLYGIYPTVQVVNGAMPCGGCHWQGKFGWHPVCDTLCANLQMIQPQQVFQALQTSARRAPMLLDDPTADRHVEALLERLQGAVPDRRSTMRGFLERLPRGAVIVETGCQRTEDDWGAGASTTLLARYCAYTGGRLTSIDLDANNISTAKSLTLGAPVSFVTEDSRKALKTLDRADGVYLDSQDTWVTGYQDCCLEEAKLASKITNLILIDDTWRLSDTWDGKGGKAVPYLLKHGWRVAVQGYQTLLVHDKALPAKKGCGCSKKESMRKAL